VIHYFYFLPLLRPSTFLNMSNNRLSHFNDKPTQKIRLKKNVKKEPVKTYSDAIHFLNGNLSVLIQLQACSIRSLL
jgi:hypothetical protein